MKDCSFCGKENASTKCCKCKYAVYCNRGCQLNDYAIHKSICIACCDFCNKEAKLHCENCKTVYYCNKECQQLHWSRHKHRCKKSRPIVTEKHKDSNIIKYKGQGIPYRKPSLSSDIYCAHGLGKRYYESGNKMYDGYFSLNKFDRNGILYSPNGNKAYEGEWKKWTRYFILFKW